MVSTFFRTVAAEPVTYTHIVFMSILFVWQWNYDIRADRTGLQFDRVVLGREYWRMIVATYTHANLMHIAFNMYSLSNYGFLEPYISSLTYFRWTFLLMMGSVLLELLAAWLSFKLLDRMQERTVYAVGYSGVVFGWMAIAAVIAPAPYPLFGFNIPAWALPFILLVLTQLLIPNASFIGHLCGIIIGFMIGYGLWDWFNDYLFLCGGIWTVLAFIASVKMTTDFPLPFIKILDPNDEQRDMSIVNGAIVYNDHPEMGAPGARDEEEGL